MVLLFVLVNLKTNALAYTSTYYKNQIIKVSLATMGSSAMTITINGNYLLNGEAAQSGTSYAINLVSGQVTLNGNINTSISFTSLNKDSYVSLQVGNTLRNYRGSMNFINKSTYIMPVNTVNIEDYVKGVIGYEMSESYPVEALKSQALASRTYGMYKIGRTTTEYDVQDNTTYQVYKGFDKSFVKIEQAVNETKGEFINYNGSLIEALFSASHGGYLEDAKNVWGNAFPYYVSKIDTYDDYSKFSNSKYYDWTRTLTAQQISDRLNYGLSTPKYNFVKINLDTIATYVSGRISNLEIVYSNTDGSQGTKVLSADSARTYFSFPSSMYTVAYNKDTNSYIFSGHGAGHGLGLSQIGALNRAQYNQGYKDILAFYYPNTTITNGISSINTISLSENDTFAGNNVQTNTVAAGGSGTGYLYKYQVEKDGQVIETKDYSSDAVFSYIPDKVGTYTVTAFLKDSLSKDDYDDKKAASFKATGFADINLDNTVDIFDLVLISKNFDKTKAASPNWNPKMDLEKDDVVDIKDLAKAASKYNIKY